MGFRRSPPSRRMTPDEVLAVFASMLPDSSAAREAGQDPMIRFEMSVEEWQNALDLYADTAWSEWKWIGRTFNDYFRISVPDREWKAVLKPTRSSTLRQVCELIASRAEVNEIRPTAILGKPCLSAGAFLAVRDTLSRVGVDVADLRPSTPLGPLLKRHRDLFEQEMKKLAPGRLPQVVTKDHLLARMFHRLMGLGLLMLLAIPVGLALWAVAAFLPRPAPVLISLGTWLMFGLAGFVVIFLGAVGAYATKSLPPCEARLGKLETVRDLCFAVLGENDIKGCTREIEKKVQSP